MKRVVSSITVFTHCWITSSNTGRSSAPRLTSSQVRSHLTPSSCSSNCCLKTLSHNCSWQSLYSLGNDHTQNTDANNTSIVVCLLRLATGVSAEVFPSNISLCWLHNNGFQAYMPQYHTHDLKAIKS